MHLLIGKAYFNKFLDVLASLNCTWGVPLAAASGLFHKGRVSGRSAVKGVAGRFGLALHGGGPATIIDRSSAPSRSVPGWC